VGARAGRPPSTCQIVSGPHLATVNQWADEAPVSVGLPAESLRIRDPRFAPPVAVTDGYRSVALLAPWRLTGGALRVVAPTGLTHHRSVETGTDSYRLAQTRARADEATRTQSRVGRLMDPDEPDDDLLPASTTTRDLRRLLRQRRSRCPPRGRSPAASQGHHRRARGTDRHARTHRRRLKTPAEPSGPSPRHTSHFHEGGAGTHRQFSLTQSVDGRLMRPHFHCVSRSGGSGEKVILFAAADTFSNFNVACRVCGSFAKQRAARCSKPSRNGCPRLARSTRTDRVRSSMGRSSPRYSPNSSSQMLRLPESAPVSSTGAAGMRRGSVT
jgi:hypothetical protein